jgi:transposase
MEAIGQLKQDVREGRIGAERLIDVIVTLQRQLEAAQRQVEAAQRQVEAAQQRIEELEKKTGVPATAKLDEPFSVRAEEKRQEKRHKKKPKVPARSGMAIALHRLYPHSKDCQSRVGILLTADVW